MAELSRDEFLAHIEPLRCDISELVRLQREANGRIAKCEIRIAVLEDRSPNRAGIMAGTVGASIIVGIVEMLKLFRQ
jgi:hypothetical protein